MVVAINASWPAVGSEPSGAQRCEVSFANSFISGRAGKRQGPRPDPDYTLPMFDFFLHT